MSAHDHHDEYAETFVAGLEWMWGEVIEDELATLIGDNCPRLVERTLRTYSANGTSAKFRSGYLPSGPLLLLETAA